MECSKNDWKAFCKKVPKWQERYMDRLTKEYIELLSSSKPSSERLWELSARMSEDRRNPGVCLTMRKSMMLYDLVQMIQLGVVDRSELDGFSDELIQNVDILLKRSEMEW